MTIEEATKAILGEQKGVRMIHDDKICSGHPWAVAAFEADSIEVAEENARTILEHIGRHIHVWCNWDIEYDYPKPVKAKP